MSICERSSTLQSCDFAIYLEDYMYLMLDFLVPHKKKKMT